jgi:hypothetical protein
MAASDADAPHLKRRDFDERRHGQERWGDTDVGDGGGDGQHGGFGFGGGFDGDVFEAGTGGGDGGGMEEDAEAAAEAFGVSLQSAPLDTSIILGGGGGGMGMGRRGSGASGSALPFVGPADATLREATAASFTGRLSEPDTLESSRQPSGGEPAGASRDPGYGAGALVPVGGAGPPPLRLAVAAAEDALLGLLGALGGARGGGPPQRLPDLGPAFDALGRGGGPVLPKEFLHVVAQHFGDALSTLEVIG